MRLTLPLIIAIVGLILYVLPIPPKVNTIGLVSFGVGLLAFLQ